MELELEKHSDSIFYHKLISILNQLVFSDLNKAVHSENKIVDIIYHDK